MACLCLGPIGSGKTLLLKRLQFSSVDDIISTVSTIGTNIAPIPRKPPIQNEKRRSWDDKEIIAIREIGGSMAPLWPSYYNNANQIIFVIDSSNLFQVSISTAMLMEMLTHEKLIGAKFLIVLAKKDLTNYKKLNHFKFMMRLDNVVSQSGNRITVEEVSSISGIGIENIRNWINSNCPKGRGILIR